MAYLVDTNLLLRSSQPSSPLYRLANTAVAALLTRGEAVHIVPQNLIEFWAVATRPVMSNSLGLSVADACQELQRLKILLLLLPEENALYATWENLVYSVGVSGKQVHDARLVAAMHVHRISHILTFNGSDFARYQSAGPGIVVVDPGSI
jgi:predicted nucleic acid-binding protein